jgi:hypothetical protein
VLEEKMLLVWIEVLWEVRVICLDVSAVALSANRRKLVKF